MDLEPEDGAFQVIPVEIMKEIIQLLGQLMKIMKARSEKDEVEYRNALELLNPTFRDQWHKLARFGAQFLMILFDTSLRRKDIPNLRINQFQQIFESEIYFWKRVSNFSCISFKKIK